ncbi:MAG: hypothetical protein KDD11_07725 [Acidobacteria bacterium]|nr:hypothetical protein [Acidobacteriota bacterium]
MRRMQGWGVIAWGLVLVVSCGALPGWAQTSVATCASQRSEPMVPTDLELCASLEDQVRHPGSMSLDAYEEVFQTYLLNWCHRNKEAGWERDKRIRDTGPYIATLENGEWVGEYYGTHAPVVIWYSAEMVDWLEKNRPLDGSVAPADAEPIPDGAIMIKEMFTPPATPCFDVDPLRLFPSSGAAIMVRDRQAAHDGWFWGWFGMTGISLDYPPPPQNTYPNMGFGQYCMNCHASAVDNLTYADLQNLEGRPGEPLVFLSQAFFGAKVEPSHHRLVTLATDDAPRLGNPLYTYDPTFVASIPAHSLTAPDWDDVDHMPSETYDNVWVPAGGPDPSSQFLTSSQCIGCHDAGGTGLQFDMTVPNPHGDNLLNVSPYATWRTSPMGLGGRDPIFYAQLASEIDTFHPDFSETIQDTCLGCHGILGQRQFAIDQPLGHQTRSDGEGCDPFLRVYANSVPYPAHNPTAPLADYGALARDGISCTACHHMVQTEAERKEFEKEPQNNCLAERQDFLNPDFTGFARTFTGSFVVGAPGDLYGPFDQPKTKPMDHAMGILPVEDSAMLDSEVCGTCHTVHLPVLHRGEVITRTYEQTTYPEWAFSAYRTGETPDGPLPLGEGKLAQSCQGCHMPSAKDDGTAFHSKIAGIQEFSNFPQAENNLGPEDIDLEARLGFARHTLVGLNVFFIQMAQQFPDILGIRTQDPMLVSKGLDPLLFTEQRMLDQASNGTAGIAVDPVSVADGKLEAKVTITSKTGHKFPSGVGFRRAFLELDVLDDQGQVLWASGRTNSAGLLVDQNGDALPGELWWKDDCSGLRNPDELVYQPHYQVIDAQDQVQIYQELVTAPADVADPRCGPDPVPGGHFTTSFMSICGEKKDNRILPPGFLPYKDRLQIAKALGADEKLAEETGSDGVGNDPDYDCSKGPCGGGDSLVYRVALSELDHHPASVRATLYYQATPPYFLQDRFCTSESPDTQRLYFLSGHLNLADTAAESWKLQVVQAETAVPSHVMLAQQPEAQTTR